MTTSALRPRSPVRACIARHSSYKAFTVGGPLLAVILTGCSGSTSQDDQVAAGEAEQVTDPVAPVESEPLAPATIAIGDIRTLEVRGVVFSSLPEVEVNATAATNLGRNLFWDPILSGDMDTACATCHLPEFGYSDGRERSVGTGGVGSGPDRVPGQIGEVSRNAPTVLNTHWNGINELGVFDPETAPMFWDARTQSLASQAIEPILARNELRGDNFSGEEILDEVISRLSSNAEYQQQFLAAFGSDNITAATIGEALAQYQSTLVANDSPYDRWLRGDAEAMSQQQINGMNVFAETGCAECHSGPMFSDFENHVLGVAEAEGLNQPDAGDGTFAFRTPSLRQLAFTAPYFHGGQDDTLADVIDFYDRTNNSDNPNVAVNQLDPDFRNLQNINNNRANAIEAFLEALNDNDFDRSRPASVPSGLPVGGAL